MKSTRLTRQTAESLQCLQSLLDECKGATTDEAVLPFVRPLTDAVRAVRSSAEDGSLSAGLSQASIATKMGVTRQAVNADFTRRNLAAADKAPVALPAAGPIAPRPVAWNWIRRILGRLRRWRRGY